MVDMNVLKTVLYRYGYLTWKDRDYYLFQGAEEAIAKMLDDFLKDRTEYSFGHKEESGRTIIVDAGTEALQNNSEVGLMQPHPALWTASSTATWEISSPTGIGTFDNVFPRTANKKLKLKKQPDHTVGLIGFIVYGNNNVSRIKFTDVNGRPWGIGSFTYQALLQDLKIIRLGQFIQVNPGSTIDIDVEFFDTSPCDVIPLAVHVVPREIAVASDLTSYVQEV